MYNIKVPSRVEQIISLFFVIGLWQGDNRSNYRKRVIKMLHMVGYVSYPVSLAVGAFYNENKNEKMFILVLLIAVVTLTVKLYYFLWKQDQILGFISKIGVHFITDNDQFKKVDNKIMLFMNFVNLLVVNLVFCIFALSIPALPIFSKEKRLPLNLDFPVDWKHNEIIYWMAFVFIFYEIVMTVVLTLVNALIWYLMMSFAIQYQTLGYEFKNFGFVRGFKTNTFLKANSQDSVRMELIALIRNHQNLEETTDEFKSCFSNLFFIQITTSALSICGSVYILAFTSFENPIELAVYPIVLGYNFFDIFMVTHFGNEIKFFSDLLSYCLFESNWFTQSESCNKCILILMEVLKRPQELVIGKVFPLDLEMFTQILKLAYSMFNILQSFK